MLFVPGVVTEAVLDAAFGVRAGFFVGEIAFPGVLPGDFPSDRRDFADALPTGGTEGLLPVLDDDNVPAALEREISLLAESLLCLSINGDLAAVVFKRLSRGLVAPPDVGGAVLGLDNAPVADCLDIITDVLAVVPADVDLGDFDVTLDGVDDNDLTGSVLFVVVVFALAGLAAIFFVSDSLPRFVAGFFSVDVAVLDLEAVLEVLIFDFVVPTRGETLVFAAVVVIVVLDNVVALVLVTLLLVLEIAVLVDPSTSCLGRAAIDLFARACDGDDIPVVRVVVEVTVFEGDVGVFVAVFVVVFIGRLVVVVAFALVAPTVVIAETASITSAVSVICSFNCSSIFTVSSSDVCAISCGLVSSSLLTGISSSAICFSDIS